MKIVLTFLFSTIGIVWVTIFFIEGLINIFEYQPLLAFGWVFCVFYWFFYMIYTWESLWINIKKVIK